MDDAVSKINITQTDLKKGKEIFWNKRNARDITELLKMKKEEGNYLIYEDREGKPVIAYLKNKEVTHEKIETFPYTPTIGLLKPIKATKQNRKQLSEIKESRLSTPGQVEDSLKKQLQDAHDYQKKEADEPKFQAAFDKNEKLDPQSVEMKIEKSKTVGGFEVGVAECKGARDSMEDAHIATELTFKIGKQEFKASLFGVFDGHGGSECSAYIAKKIAGKLTARLQKINKEGLTEAGIYNALKMTFVDLTRDYKGIDGSTATTALVIGNDIYVANVGDSRTLIEHNGSALTMSVDAEPEAEKFKKSIETREGAVHQGRIMYYFQPALAVARAVGDKSIQGVTARPKITKYTLEPTTSGESRHLILACDGLFDVCSSRQVASAVNELNKKVTLNPTGIAERLVKTALYAGSGDNITAMVVKL